MIGLLCNACVELLQEAFDQTASPRLYFPREVIKIMPDSKPPPYEGDYFLAVYGSSFGSALDDGNVSLDAYMGISVTLTLRTPKYPMGKIGSEAYAKAYRGMSSIMWKIMKTLDKKPALLTKVAAYEEYDLIRDEGGQLFEYLRWANTDAAPLPVYDEHFSAYNEHLNDQAGLAIMGHTMTANFDRARAGNLQYDENA